MPEIPTLTQTLTKHALRYEGSILGFGCNCGVLLVASDAAETDRDRVYAEHVDEMHRHARTIRELSEFQELPAGSVTTPMSADCSEFNPLTNEWVDLPALVVHTPADGTPA